MEDLDDLIVFDGYTRKALKSTFDLVCNKENWKLPIDAEVDCANLTIVCTAIAFYVGCYPYVKWSGNGRYYQVTSPGYYQIIGA